MPRSLVALGSNLGDRAGAIATAIEQLTALAGVSSPRASRNVETLPAGGPAGQGPYLNAAVSFETSLSAESLFAALEKIETALGRRRGQRWAARAIDLDLLLYGDLVIDSPSLEVPHPRMAFRRFVLEPAAEVAADMVHPTIGWTIGRLLAHVESALPYIAHLGMPGSGKTALATRVAGHFGGRFLADPATRSLALEPAGSTAGGPALAREIEFLDRRARLLDKKTWPGDKVLAASDFYLEQGLAYARLLLTAADGVAFDEAMAAARAQVVLPKLLVVLDTPPAGRRSAASPPANVVGDAPPEAHVGGTAPLRENLLSLAARPGIGPVLYAGRGNAEAQFAEISAAIAAMQTRSIVP
jgi:2-amino-4-hydroxy-6-hydroxymethyldihydropteridine diphosphokinase